jgi:hypothetical protein
MSQFAWKIRNHIGSRAGLIVGIVISLMLGSLLITGKKAPARPAPILPMSSIDERDPRIVARPHLNWAATKCFAEVEQPLQHVRALFADARSRSRDFAEVALGWDSKLTIVSDYFQQKDDLSTFLRENFESMVISEGDLLSAIQQGISQFQQATFSIEGEMLVRLRSDASDFNSSPLVVTSDIATLLLLFQQAISQSGSAAALDLKAAVAREVASYILGDIATQVTVQLSVSSGILGAGAATGWTSFGITMVVGLAVDQMITAGYEAYADPKGRLASQINSQLDAMEQLIIEGTDDQPGLRTRLQQFARERAMLRESAVLQLLTGTQGGAR